MTSAQPILQFGTGRFLQAHVDLFVSQALHAGRALGGITVVQTTGSAASSARRAVLAEGAGYPVRLRGLKDGVRVDETVQCTAIRAALHTDADWRLLRDLVATGPVQVIVSNTGDAGWRLDARDGPHLLAPHAEAPISYPAKLLVLLHGRWSARPQAGLSVLPCELVRRNGDVLRQAVVGIAREWQLGAGLIDHLSAQVRWGNSLVDRIVSEPLQPVGAVAEPYALWAIERQAGLVLPCVHPAIVSTDDLGRHERLKLHLLNLGHTVLAEQWLARRGDPQMTVLQAMGDPAMRAGLEAVWAEEVLPVFDALGERAEAVAYTAEVRERFLNPWLAHRLADIADHHAEKKLRRLAPVVELADQHRLSLPQPTLRAALAAARQSESPHAG